MTVERGNLPNNERCGGSRLMAGDSTHNCTTLVCITQVHNTLCHPDLCTYNEAVICTVKVALRSRTVDLPISYSLANLPICRQPASTRLQSASRRVASCPCSALLPRMPGEVAIGVLLALPVGLLLYTLQRTGLLGCGVKQAEPRHREILAKPLVAAGSDPGLALEAEGQPTRRIALAAGCFWGVQLAFQRLPGVRQTAIGYIGGQGGRPTYEAVCSQLHKHPTIA